MRIQILKGSSTKAERIFAEYLKRNRIPFKYKVIIGNREIDFLIGKVAIEIDGHDQDGSKNEMLVKEGYTPLHFTNKEIINNKKYNGINLFSKRNFSRRVKSW